MLGQKNILAHARRHVRLHRGKTEKQVLEKATSEREQGIVNMYFGHLLVQPAHGKDFPRCAKLSK
jgi:hypothetical protein